MIGYRGVFDCTKRHVPAVMAAASKTRERLFSVASSPEAATAIVTRVITRRFPLGLLGNRERRKG